ncbi:hypothetical protein N7461_008322 [Penicillium sp. DV-2018c]|nr:hypothetical protein N7461_008322 [Penicillium sp. DV-2018c]
MKERESKKEKYPDMDRTIYDAIWSKYRSIVIDDAASFDGASIDSIRAHYEKWQVTNRRCGFYNVRQCLLIDDESLRTLEGARAEWLEREDLYGIDPIHRWVKVVVAWLDVENERWREPLLAIKDICKLG